MPTRRICAAGLSSRYAARILVMRHQYDGASAKRAPQSHRASEPTPRGMLPQTAHCRQREFTRCGTHTLVHPPAVRSDPKNARIASV